MESKICWGNNKSPKWLLKTFMSLLTSEARINIDSQECGKMPSTPKNRVDYTIDCKTQMLSSTITVTPTKDIMIGMYI